MTTSQLYHDAAAGNQKTWTFSAWIKKSNLGSNAYLFSQGSSGSNYIGIYFGTNDEFKVYNEVSSSQTLYFVTNRLLRDTSAWYHIVVQCDTTQATEADRFKIWINGSQETSFSSASYPAQNSDTNMNAATRERIGVYHPGGSSPNHYWNGYMSHVSLVDGSVVAPTVFGQTDSTSGIWKFKSPSGVTWGTNGFHLKFENSGALGTDSSGQSNTFSVSGDLKQALDTPSNNHSTYDRNFVLSGSLSTGSNTYATSTSYGSHSNTATSTFGVSSGKWYAEFKHAGTSGSYPNGMVGVYYDPGLFQSGKTNPAQNDDEGWGYAENGNIYNNGSTSTGTTYTTGDVIGVALDLDGNKVYWYKNNALVNSGGTTIDADKTYYFFVSDTSGSGSTTYQANFGNGLFGTTAITSAGLNGNGSLFEFDCPSGYYALNTKNINTYG